MTGTEFFKGIALLEKFFQKEIPQYEKDIWYKELSKITYDRFNQIIQYTYTQYKFMPKLADIIEINKTLTCAKKQPYNDQPHKCNRCNSTGFIFYTKIVEGHTYQYAARCNCSNGMILSHKIPTIGEIGLEV